MATLFIYQVEKEELKLSEIFNLVNESKISNKMFASSYTNENHVETSIAVLESLNRSFVDKSKTLFNRVSESVNAKEENVAIQNFVNEIQGELDKLQSQISGQYERFVIAASNACNVAKEQLDSMDKSNIRPYTDHYIKFNSEKLSDSGFPRMNPYDIFEREFNFIAQLMQELPATASHKDKLGVVSTVYNNFSKAMSGDVSARIHGDMFGDACKNGSSIQDCLFSALKDADSSGEKSIGSEEFSDAESCIMNIDEYIKAIADASDKLISDLRNIVDDLNNIVMGSNSNKFKVDTKVDGIRNTTYSVDVYTSNKVLWLVREKINQIVNVYNKYILALSVKMEVLMGYIKQSCDIIGSMIYMDKLNPIDRSDDDEPEQDDDIDNGIEDDDFTDEEPAEPIEEDPEDDNALDGGDDILTPEDETENDEDPTPNFEVNDDDELQEAVASFYISLYEYSYVCDQMSIMEHVTSLLLEDENQPGGSGDGGGDSSKDTGTDATNTTDNTKNDTLQKTRELVGKAAETKQSVWKSIISKMVGLWNKFKDNILKNYQKKVQFLNDNKKYIMMPAMDHEIVIPAINHDNINKITIPDFNYAAMKTNLDSKESFMKSQPSLKEFMPSGAGESVSQKVRDFVIDPKRKITNSKEIDPKKIYTEYCAKFIDILDNIKSMTDIIEKGEKNADALVKHVQTESSKITVENLYFTEQEFKAVKDGNGESDKEDSTTSNISNQLKVYFTACGEVLAAKMSISQKVFDEYNAYLTWHINKKKEASEGKKGKSEPVKDSGEPASKFD